MNKVLVVVNDNCIYFSKYNRDISSQNLNNTNVINAKNLKFTEEYIKDNMDLISTFFNLLVLKFKVDRVVIKELEIAETIVTLVNTLNSIKYVCFIEDSSLNYTISSLLLQNKNLEEIECYNLPEIMFYKFGPDIIKTRGNILSISTFFDYNNINTYSDVYNKKTIIIPKLFTDADIDDLKYFFKTNKNLKKVEFKPYNRINLETILKLLKINNLSKVKIIIYEDEENTKEILNDISFFDKLNKKFNVDIRIKYSNKYKEKNKVKEFNIILLKYAIGVCIIISCLLFVAYKFLDKKNNNLIEGNIEEINKLVEDIEQEKNNDVEEIDPLVPENNSQEIEQQYISSYYQNYSKVYNELLKVNDDTVGWLTVNGTKINYPIVQTKDNEYYLNHAYDKSRNGIGWLFVDYRNDMNNISQNTIIYGHSLVKGGLMFSTLKNILANKWYNDPNNLIINFSIKGREIKWQVFSVYTIEVTSDYLYTNFNNEDTYINFINMLKNRSINNFNVEVNGFDKILTLSTCYEDSNHRLVLHAKML